MTASTGTKFKLGLSLIFAKNWDYILLMRLYQQWMQEVLI
ncbi:hypothetical protein SPAR118_0039 [Streptococcus pneumoniae GA54644]|nr:hypothetical protein SPAR118_0039 [Streptococcus pneumoniae GA54644]